MGLYLTISFAILGAICLGICFFGMMFFDKQPGLGVSIPGLIAFILAAIFLSAYSPYESISKREACYSAKADINLTAANMLNSASKISTFVDKNTEVYEEIMDGIADARKDDYSAESIDRVYKLIVEKYPAGMELGELWRSYVNEVHSAYEKILDAQKNYNDKVKDYKSIFTPLVKFALLYSGAEEDKSITYYTLEGYSIDYDLGDY